LCYLLNRLRRIDEEQAAKIIRDDGVDHKRHLVYIDSIKHKTEKAILARVGHWRQTDGRMAAEAAS